MFSIATIKVSWAIIDVLPRNPGGPNTMTQSITLLRTRGPKLAKTWGADGAIADYDNAKTYTVKRRPVADLASLAMLLATLQTDPRSCIIRGAPASEIGASQVVERNLDVFSDEPSKLFMIDVDKYHPMIEDVLDNPAAAVAEFVDTLPQCFREANYVWQLSGSCGHPSKGGGLRAHLWFWLQAPLTCEQAEAWSLKYVPTVDGTVHRTVQVNYTSNPVMAGGVTDPLAGRRLGFHNQALRDLLVIPADMPVPAAGEVTRVKRKERATAMVDPRDKPGVVGALCRAFEPTEIVTLFPEHFEASDRDPTRITWLQGGGAKEGLKVADNGTHIFNSHSTAPVTHACNLFDFIRIHVFGHLDEGIEQDVLDLDITASPSYKAAVAWALALPEVQAQSASPEAVAAVEAQAEAKAERVLSEREERAQRMANIQALIARAESLDVLEHDIARRVGKAKTFSVADRVVIANAMHRRSRELMPGTRGQPMAVVRDWLRAGVAEAGPAFAHMTPEGLPRLTIENVEALCAQEGIEIRYNVITKDIEILGLTREYGRDNVSVAQLADLQSRMAALGMPNTTSAVAGIVTAVAATQEYNPVLDWIDGRPWDGESRIQALADTIVCPPNSIDPKLKTALLRKWLIQGAAAAATERPLQFRGVLTFSGAQYKGKSRWLKSLVPGHEGWAITGRTIDPHNKDSVNTAITHWLCELGELDSTFKKSDIAALKGWIAADEDVYRKPYAAKDSRHTRRTICFASVNGEEFLQDETGNSRFWVIPVERCETEHGIDMQQVWAEVMVAWRGGEPHWLEQGEMETVMKHNTRFEQRDGLVDLILSKFAWEKAGFVRPPGVELGVPIPGSDPSDLEAPVWVRLASAEIAIRVGFGANAVATPTLTTKIGTRMRSLGCNGGSYRNQRFWEVPVTDMGGL